MNNYRTDMIQALGGVEGILEHTLFKGTDNLLARPVFYRKKSICESFLIYTVHDLKFNINVLMYKVIYSYEDNENLRFILNL